MNTIARIIFALALLTPITSGATDQLSNTGEQASSLGEALEKANRYSFDTGGIAIIISYGSGNSGDPDRIGKAFVEEIKRRGQSAKYFFHYVEWPGVSMSYRVGYSSFGPWSIDDAAANIGDVVRRAEAAHRIQNQ